MLLSIAVASMALFALVGYRNHDSLIEEYGLEIDQIFGLVILLVITSFFSYYFGTKYYDSK
jgi:hypothetical protein